METTPNASINTQPSTIHDPLFTVPRLVWRYLNLALGGVFVYAGALKAIEPLRFASDMENYHIVPWPLGLGLAFYLPWLEIFCGLMLVLRRLYAGALAILISLIVVFVGASISAKLRGIDISCGCFGRASNNLSFSWHLAIDLAIVTALVMLWRRMNANVAGAGDPGYKKRV